MELPQLINKFCDECRYNLYLSENTITAYRKTVEYYQKYSGVKTINQMTELSVKQFMLHGSMEKNWKPTTYRTIHMNITQFVKWCIKYNYIKGPNFMRSFELPRIPPSLPKHLNKSTTEQLLDRLANLPMKNNFIRSRNYAMIATCIFAGLRKKELLSLRLSQVDLEGLTITIIEGKGKKDRIIPINYKLAGILNEYLKERINRNKTCPEFFTSYLRNCGLSIASLAHIVNVIKRQTGIQFGMHKLRHTFATLLGNSGINLLTLMELMGHSNIKTTMRYVSVFTERLREDIQNHPLG
jgi:site-specific recombinase XerD